MPSPLKKRDLAVEVGRRMRQARDRAGISATDAAEELGINRRTLHNWESGSVYAPAVALVLMCDLYGCSADWLLAPPGTFRALHDPQAEKLALAANDLRSFSEHAHSVSVFVTERLQPMTSLERWADSMRRVAERGRELRGKEDGGA